MPDKTPEGSLVYVGTLLSPNADKFIFNQAVTYVDFTLNLDHLSKDPAEGHIAVFDVKQFTFDFLIKFAPLGLKKYIYYIQVY